ncbi:hypothetical protein ACA910_020772 [Epithemia clementina (nom. ined.)]
MAVISLKGHGAPVESFFSSLSYQKPKIRNRLTFDNLKIISTIRKNLKRSGMATPDKTTTNINSRKRAKTTGVDTTVSDNFRQQDSTTVETTASRHVQDSFLHEHTTTTYDDTRNLLNQVVEAGAATPTVQDINFEDEFEQMIRDVEEEGIAENVLIAFYNEDSDDDNNSRQQEQEPPRERDQGQQQPRQANNNSAITSTIHQEFNLKILQEIEDWIQSDPYKNNDTRGTANEEAGEGKGNSANDHDDYEHKYTLDDIINF